MTEFAQGQTLKSWKDVTTVLDGATHVWVRWPDGYKLCKIVNLKNKSVSVETPNGGLLDITTPKAMRAAIKSGLMYAKSW